MLFTVSSMASSAQSLTSRPDMCIEFIERVPVDTMRFPGIYRSNTCATEYILSVGHGF